MSAVLPKRSRWVPAIQVERCTGCGWCVGSCPEHLLTLEVANWRKTSTLHTPEACTGCAKCVRRCVFGVIRMVERPTGAP